MEIFKKRKPGRPKGSKTKMDERILREILEELKEIKACLHDVRNNRAQFHVRGG